MPISESEADLIGTGAKAYFMRRVLHDYSDDDCVKILSHLRAAMAQDSKLLIQDQVMPSVITNPELEANVAVLDVATMVMAERRGV
jgi:O-methyltransferase domain